jgi:DNA polymerase-1
VLEYRALDKLRGTYLTKLPGFVGDDGRIHTTFLQDVAATGRLASNDPNLQNIPIRTFEGRRIRACFVPKPGHRFVSADYSQVELRVLAHVTQDPVLLEGFRQGADIHARTATELFGVPAGEVTVAQRSAAKAINFGLLYGMSAFRLARELGISGAEAQGYVEAYFSRMPNVKGWIEATKAEAKRTGWVETLFGRRRMIPEIHSAAFQERSAGEREAVNTVIQGTAADLIKRAMLRAEAAVDALALGATLVLQVHDELLFEVPDAAVEAVRAAVVAAMQDEPGITVPLAVSSAVGATWNEAHG